MKSWTSFLPFVRPSVRLPAAACFGFFFCVCGSAGAACCCSIPDRFSTFEEENRSEKGKSQEDIGKRGKRSSPSSTFYIFLLPKWLPVCVTFLFPFNFTHTFLKPTVTGKPGPALMSEPQSSLLLKKQLAGTKVSKFLRVFFFLGVR